MKKINITTLGCKVNQYESASFLSQFEERGHQIVSSGTDSDIIVINTCTVTGKASSQSRQELRRALRNNLSAKIVVTGCYTQIASKELAEMQELQGRSVVFVGNSEKDLLVDLALQDKAPLSRIVKDIKQVKEIAPLRVTSFGSRTRAYLKIQDGCNAFCSYCIVPYARGRSRSLPEEKVIEQAILFRDQGYKEIVITGIHLGQYGTDLHPPSNISTILGRLCRTTPDIRYRLSSIEPLEISTELLSTVKKYHNFMPHLHIPLQSGANEVLAKMNRRYSTNQFQEKLDLCHTYIDDLAVGIDVMVGFPGETEDHFHQTHSFLKALDFTYLHVFPYSKRPGTPAADFNNHIPKEIKEKRVQKLRELGDQKKRDFYTRYLGKTRPTLVESKRNVNDQLRGFTDNYIPVVFSGDDTLKKSIIEVKLEKLEKSHVKGKSIQ